MKRRWSLTSIGGALLMLAGLTAAASGRIQTFHGRLPAGGMLNRVSQGPRSSQGQRGLQAPHRLRGAQGPQRSQGPHGPQEPRRVTGPECHAAFCG